MKRAVVFLVVVMALSACGGGDGSGPTQTPFVLENVNYAKVGLIQTSVTGIIRNVDGKPYAFVRINFQAFTTDDAFLSIGAQGFDNFPRGGWSKFSILINDGGRPITRWESWIEWW